MDRRNFLAFIPTLSAIPFIGKNIEKTDSGIFISKPELCTLDQPIGMPSNIDPMKLEVRLYNGNKKVGEAYIREFNIWNETIDISCRDSGGARTIIQGLNRAQFNCELKHWL